MISIDECTSPILHSGIHQVKWYWGAGDESAQDYFHGEHKVACQRDEQTGKRCAIILMIWNVVQTNYCKWKAPCSKQHINNEIIYNSQQSNVFLYFVEPIKFRVSVFVFLLFLGRALWRAVGGISKHGQLSLVCVAVTLCACQWIKKQSRFSSFGLIKNKVYISMAFYAWHILSSALQNHCNTYVTSPISLLVLVSLFFVYLTLWVCVYSIINHLKLIESWCGGGDGIGGGHGCSISVCALRTKSISKPRQIDWHFKSKPGKESLAYGTGNTKNMNARTISKHIQRDDD